MKVRLLMARVVGTPGGGSFGQSKGDEIEVDDAEGARMIADGQCVEVVGDTPRRMAANASPGQTPEGATNSKPVASAAKGGTKAAKKV
ncbi:MAG: hypothetical protein V4719_10110 [Planctomycetota bacterium]